MNSSRSRAALALLAVFACLVVVACGGENGGQTTATVRTATPTIPTATAPAATPSPVPSAGAPRENGYELAPTLPEARLRAHARLRGDSRQPQRSGRADAGRRHLSVALDGSFSPTVFGDVSGLLIANPGNEEGLLGLAFSPTFVARRARLHRLQRRQPPTQRPRALRRRNGAMDMGERAGHPGGGAAVCQSQRRPACVRAGRLPVLGPGRRRFGGRPAAKRAEAVDAAGVDPAPRRLRRRLHACRRTIRS